MTRPEHALRLERRLSCHDGIRSVTVGWDVQAVKVEFDETTISVQAVARQIALSSIPDRDEGIVGRLLLKVPSVRSDEKARLPMHVLCQLRGVESVSPQIAFQAVTVRFALEGDLTTDELIRALKAEGIAANLI